MLKALLKRSASFLYKKHSPVAEGVQYRFKLYVVEIYKSLKTLILSLCSVLCLSKELACTLRVAKRREGIE